MRWKPAIGCGLALLLGGSAVALTQTPAQQAPDVAVAPAAPAPRAAVVPAAQPASNGAGAQIAPALNSPTPIYLKQPGVILRTQAETPPASAEPTAPQRSE